jgi:hypothetical protein
MKDVMKKQRQARRKIIRQWTTLPRDKRQSVDQIAAFAKTAAQQNANAFVHSRRSPYQRITGWLLPRAGRFASDRKARFLRHEAAKRKSAAP